MTDRARLEKAVAEAERELEAATKRRQSAATKLQRAKAELRTLEDEPARAPRADRRRETIEGARRMTCFLWGMAGAAAVLVLAVSIETWNMDGDKAR
jgi:hypothetical protein